MVRSQTLPIDSPESVVAIRRCVREEAASIGFGLVSQTKIVTAASELARNTLDHGGGGVARIEVIEKSGEQGIRIAFEDEGPGIGDVERALSDGYSSGGGLGVGLGGARRLVEEFEISSEPGRGTTVVATRWS